ncbi:MAG: hypothetical protein NXI32_18490 [bacterium]|nr:hypothetical protein [bacterium]
MVLEMELLELASEGKRTQREEILDGLSRAAEARPTSEQFQPAAPGWVLLNLANCGKLVHSHGNVF